MEKDQASQLIAMYGGRFPDYSLHSMHTQLQHAHHGVAYEEAVDAELSEEDGYEKNNCRVF